MRASPPLLAALLLAPLAASHAAEPLRYNRDIRPILSENCFACHGPDKANQKAGLRLDVRDAAIQPAKSGDSAIVPGDAEKSTLVARIFEEADGGRETHAIATLQLLGAACESPDGARVAFKAGVVAEAVL